MNKSLLIILICAVQGLAFAADFDAVKGKLETAMAADVRSESERDRDRNRKPEDTLQFFDLRDDMKVVELLPGGGWYTKLLAPVLAENGELFVAYGTSNVSQNVLGEDGFDKVKYAAAEAKIYRPEGSRFYVLENPDLGVSDVDIIFTFRNYHNFGAEGRAAINQAVYDALKPGGIYAMVDHNRRHMQSDNSENRRRVDAVLAIKEVQAAGFELVDYSDLHYRPDDELRYEVGRKTVTGNTDRWTLKFRKTGD